MSHKYIIAEMACSHEGSLKLARQIIDAAGQSGADAIQFQIWVLQKMMVPDHPDYKLLSSIELLPEDWKALMNYTREKYPLMEIIACINELDSLALCEKMGIDAYKIHISDISNFKLIRNAAATGKRIDLCIGASTITEIQEAIECIKSTSNNEIWLMYGYQNFPTEIDKINLDYMRKLQRLFELPVGYQDHTDADSPAGFWLCAAAIGMGIDIIEKHITHNRSLKGIDHQAALNPKEFGQFVQMVRTIETAQGISTPKSFSDEEKKYRKYSKKCLVALRELYPGHCLTHEDFAPMRTPEFGLTLNWADSLLGRRIKHKIKTYQVITTGDLD